MSFILLLISLASGGTGEEGIVTLINNGINNNNEIKRPSVLSQPPLLSHSLMQQRNVEKQHLLRALLTIFVRDIEL